MADITKEQQGDASKALLETISAMFDGHPSFDHGGPLEGVENVDCSEITFGPEDDAAKVATTRRMTVQIENETFVVLAYCQS